MLDDKDLEGLRAVFSETVLRPMRDHEAPVDGTWSAFIAHANESTARALMDDKTVPEAVRLYVVDLMIEIGVRECEDVLTGAPLPLDYPATQPWMRRWQLRRELNALVDRMDMEDLQRAVWHAHALVGPGGGNGAR